MLVATLNNTLRLQASYQPIAVSEELVIIPAWQEAPPSPPGGAAPLPLILEPGLAFGTGDHPTTQLCLRWLLRQRAAGSLAGASVVDYGTGSGVLAVAALLLGASHVVCVCNA